MDKRRFVVLAACLTICLTMGTLAMAATIPSGNVTYWDNHYLAGQTVKPGPDIFGWNFQARGFNGFCCNAFSPYWGGEPFEGDRAVDGWMNVQWNEAYLSNQDGDDPDTHLDFHPFVDWPGANHDTSSGNWQGSGAVVSSDFSYWTVPEGMDELVPVWTHMSWVAVPADAYVEWVPVCEGAFYCPFWYEYEGGSLIGSSQPWSYPAGEWWSWAEVKHLTYCGPLGLVCNVDSPSYSPGLGGPGGR